MNFAGELAYRTIGAYRLIGRGVASVTNAPP
jgi:hypothetical protein